MIDYEKKLIKCDRCGSVFMSDSAQQAEREAQQCGWLVLVDEDVCDICNDEEV